jgi:mersacidin/lichenicidin family type 2 lantibiotic
MSLKHIIESWRDEEYRENLDAETRSLLPGSPAGEIELNEVDLAEANGGITDDSFTFGPRTITITYLAAVQE